MKRPQRHKFRMLDNGLYLILFNVTMVYRCVFQPMHHSFPSIPLNRHNGHETSTASSSSSVQDVPSAINFAMSRWSIDVLFQPMHHSFPSIPLNRHNGHETSSASSSSSVHDVHSAIYFACLIMDCTLSFSILGGCRLILPKYS